MTSVFAGIAMTLDGIDGTSLKLETDILETTMGTTHLSYHVAS